MIDSMESHAAQIDKSKKRGIEQLIGNIDNDCVSKK